MSSNFNNDFLFRKDCKCLESERVYTEADADLDLKRYCEEQRKELLDAPYQEPFSKLLTEKGFECLKYTLSKYVGRDFSWTCELQKELEKMFGAQFDIDGFKRATFSGGNLSMLNYIIFYV